jgi:3-deoxy-D-manno-octulosonate 8-phosphate phosphatase (KDO 8-P phosphatase)
MFYLRLMNLAERFKRIRALVFDMDGVLTDGQLLVMPGGEWVRRMNIKDGYALQLAVKSGYHVAVITGSVSTPVSERLARLGIMDVFQQVPDKAACLRQYMEMKGLNADEVLFMGDDVPDCEAMQCSGLGACPADAAADVREIAVYISTCKGGEGCVRDVIERVLKASGNWSKPVGIRSI